LIISVKNGSIFPQKNWQAFLIKAGMILQKLRTVFFVVLLVSIFTSCAAAANLIADKTWVGVLDLVAAAGIVLYIFRESNK
jgi:hypothetical protein